MGVFRNRKNGDESNSAFRPQALNFTASLETFKKEALDTVDFSKVAIGACAECGILAPEPGDIYCDGCRSAADRDSDFGPREPSYMNEITTAKRKTADKPFVYMSSDVICKVCGVNVGPWSSLPKTYGDNCCPNCGAGSMAMGLEDVTWTQDGIFGSRKTAYSSDEELSGLCYVCKDPLNSNSLYEDGRGFDTQSCLEEYQARKTASRRTASSRWMVASGESQNLGEVVQGFPSFITPTPGTFAIFQRNTQNYLQGRLTSATVNKWGVNCPVVEVCTIDTVTHDDNSIWGEAGDILPGIYWVHPDAVDDFILPYATAKRKTAFQKSAVVKTAEDDYYPRPSDYYGRPDVFSDTDAALAALTPADFPHVHPELFEDDDEFAEYAIHFAAWNCESSMCTYMISTASAKAQYRQQAQDYLASHPNARSASRKMAYNDEPSIYYCEACGKGLDGPVCPVDGPDDVTGPDSEWFPSSDEEHRSERQQMGITSSRKTSLNVYGPDAILIGYLDADGFYCTQCQSERGGPILSEIYGNIPNSMSDEYVCNGCGRYLIDTVRTARKNQNEYSGSRRRATRKTARGHADAYIENGKWYHATGWDKGSFGVVKSANDDDYGVVYISLDEDGDETYDIVVNMSRFDAEDSVERWAANPNTAPFDETWTNDWDGLTD